MKKELKFLIHPSTFFLTKKFASIQLKNLLEKVFTSHTRVFKEGIRSREFMHARSIDTHFGGED